MSQPPTAACLPGTSPSITSPITHHKLLPFSLPPFFPSLSVSSFSPSIHFILSFTDLLTHPSLLPSFFSPYLPPLFLLPLPFFFHPSFLSPSFLPPDFPSPFLSLPTFLHTIISPPPHIRAGCRQLPKHTQAKEPSGTHTHTTKRSLNTFEPR